MSELVVISGASRGIGLATAMRFVARGAQVINLSRSPCDVPGVAHFSVDFGDPGFERVIARPLAEAAEAAERVVLVHNAAMLPSDSADSVDVATLERTLAVGVVAPAIVNRLLIPAMRRGSAIIYIGSTLSEKAVAGVFSYVVSKHASVGMMRATCQDLLGKGIHTACVCPGVTDTEMLRARVAGDPQVLEVLRAMTGEGRLIEPAEIAKVIEMVADQPVLNGSIIHANLGQRER